DHVRQRKILNPAFSPTIVRDSVPVFIQITQNVRDIRKANGGPCVMNVHDWLSRVALDAIGQAAFSYDFGALSDKPCEFVNAYKGLL
ncbi:hypothetical protein M422DRAFT_161643, partial [Sphaerobolus stellatus SS14]